MESFIEKILYGRSQSEFFPEPEGYWKREDRIDNVYKKLTAVLNEEQKKLLEEYVDAVEDQQVELLAHYYKEGFKIGLMLAAESALK